MEISEMKVVPLDEVIKKQDKHPYLDEIKIMNEQGMAVLCYVANNFNELNDRIVIKALITSVEESKRFNNTKISYFGHMVDLRNGLAEERPMWWDYAMPVKEEKKKEVKVVKYKYPTLTNIYINLVAIMFNIFNVLSGHDWQIILGVVLLSILCPITVYNIYKYDNNSKAKKV